ncbi:Protein of unknown function [Gryllus bimaculatus]|nr:Protein of unknown function [Gryllus bimaculatus]
MTTRPYKTLVDGLVVTSASDVTSTMGANDHWKCRTLCVLMVVFLMRTVRAKDIIKFKELEPMDSNALIVELTDVNAKANEKGLLETNVTAELKRDLPEDAVVCVDGYEMGANGYGKSTLNLPCTNLCELIKNDDCIYPNVQKASVGTLPESGCPISQGIKEIKQHLLDIPCLPDKIQRVSDDWKFDVQVKSKDESEVYYHVEVKVDIVS